MKLFNKTQLAIRHAASSDEMRYVINSVLVEELKNGQTRLVATNGQILAWYEGSTLDEKEYPVIPELKAATNSTKSAIVPIGAINAAVKSMPKHNRLPALNNVACVLGKEQVTLATTNIETNNVQSVKPIEGPFPQWDQIAKRLEGKPVKARLGIGVEVLEKILKIMKENDVTGAEFKFHGDGDAFEVTVKNRDGVTNIIAMPFKI